MIDGVMIAFCQKCGNNTNIFKYFLLGTMTGMVWLTGILNTRYFLNILNKINVLL